MILKFIFHYIFLLVFSLAFLLFLTSCTKNSVKERLTAFNTRVNNYIQYESDLRQFGVKDYWQTPIEVLKNKKGDCEDYVVLKHMLLKENLKFLYNPKMGLLSHPVKPDHAVLIYDGYVLDNERDEVLLVQDYLKMTGYTLVFKLSLPLQEYKNNKGGK